MLKSAPKLHLSNVRSILFSFLLIGLAFTLGYLVRDRNYLNINTDSSRNVVLDRSVPEEYGDLNFDLFWHIWNTLDTSYFDKTKLDDEKMVYGAIKGMVSAVGDPYTVFLTPAENKVTQEDLSGEFGGVGIQIGFKGTDLAVVAPLPDSPAEEAGVQPGDIIAGIRDLNKDIERGTQGITLPEAIQTIRGEVGTTITLSLVREGVDHPILVDLTRNTIDVPSVIASFVGDSENISYIQVLKFGGDTKNEWDDAVLQTLQKSDLQGVIVDVRNNPGGYLQGAVDLASDFLSLGDVVVIEENSKDERNEFTTQFAGRLTRDKVVVLVNGGSASASEIFSGALRDNINAPVIGQNTFGKGTIQEPRQLEGGLGLHMTIGRWLTPSGFWVNEVGLEPDIIVENDPETPEDEQLQTAIDFFSGNSNLSGIN